MAKFIPKPLTDGIFKYLFGYKKNIRFTEYLLECLFNKERGYFHNNIEVTNSIELDRNGALKRVFKEDVKIVYKNMLIINIEPYTTFNKDSVTKSFSYANNEYLNQFESGDDLKNPKLFIQYNIIKDTKYKTKEYTMMSTDEEKELLFEQKESFLIRIINLKDIDNIDVNEKGKRLLRFLGANNMKEAKCLAKGDDMLMEMYDYAEGFVKSSNEQIALINKLYYDGRAKEAHDEGLSQGLSQGIHNVAKNMLRTGSSKSYVSEVTGLTEKELDKLK